MRIRRQRGLGHRQRFDQHPLRTFAGLHPLRYESTKTYV
jgi:hypothetical protein